VVGVGVGVGVGTIVDVGVDDGEAAVGEGEAPTIDVVVAVVVVVALAVAFAETLGLGFVVELVQPATAPTASTSAIIATTFLIIRFTLFGSLKNQKRKAAMIRFKGSLLVALRLRSKKKQEVTCYGDVSSLALFAAFQAARTLLKILYSVTKHSPRSTIATAAPPTGPSTANIAAMISTATTSSQKPTNKNSPRNSPWTKDSLIVSPRPQMPPLRRYDVPLGFSSSAHVTITPPC